MSAIDSYWHAPVAATQSYDGSRIRLILDSIGAPIYIRDNTGRYLYANRKAVEFLGPQADSPSELQAMGKLMDAAIEHEQQTLLLRHQTTSYERLISRNTGKEHSFQAVRIPLLNDAGDVEAICSILTDTTDREYAYHLSFYDHLTKLPNRQMLMQRLTHALGCAHEHDSVNALLVLDLDKFKIINDAHGLEVGDYVLQEVGQLLMANTRERDTVARISADEFMILLMHVGPDIDTGARNARKLAEKLQRALAGMNLEFDGKSCVLGASIGLTMLQSGVSTLDDVVREADIAMSRARQQGGNSVVFYDSSIQYEQERRIWLEHDLTQALHTQQLSMHLQPQYTDEGIICGAELLARWHHPERGEIPPGQFIPLAEESGLINHLSKWTLLTACNTVKALKELGHEYPLSLNISPKWLMSPDFVQTVAATLAQTQTCGKQLIFEVTEGVLIHDTLLTARNMAELQRLGIRFSVDDFGTGYSNLVYLKRLPLYELKIDRSLVKDLPHDPGSVVIAQLILTMAGKLDLRVVAEGVETKSQSDFLLSNNCNALQGYFLARPLPVDDWLEQIRAQQSS